MVLFFFNDTATTEIYTLSLHDALPILRVHTGERHVTDVTAEVESFCSSLGDGLVHVFAPHATAGVTLIELGSGSESDLRSEEHTSELQSRQYLVCRLLLEKKKKLSIIKPELFERFDQHIGSIAFLPPIHY